MCAETLRLIEPRAPFRVHPGPWDYRTSSPKITAFRPEQTGNGHIPISRLHRRDPVCKAVSESDVKVFGVVAIRDHGPLGFLRIGTDIYAQPVKYVT
jgi:hypothetical protein